MSTPSQGLPLSSNVMKWFNTFTNVALAATQAAAQIKSDLSQGEHLQAVNDAVTAAANTAASMMPAEAPMIGLSVAVFNIGEGLLESFISIFHHPAPAAPAPAAPQAAPASPPAPTGVV